MTAEKLLGLGGSIGFFFSVELSFFFKKSFEQGVVEFLEHAASGFEVVVAARQGAEVDGSADTTHFLVRKAIVDFSDPRDDEGTGAHRAGFFCYVERAFIQPPIAQAIGGLGDGEDFGMSRRVVGRTR